VCKRLNQETVLMAMIETPGAVENADAIAAVDGIDVLHIGASGLSTEMGIPGQYAHDRMKAASRPSPRRRAPTARRWASAACARISNSRAG
jgi:2-keto-3-deoxy-L-rhamnonate aldolase RhmA